MRNTSYNCARVYYYITKFHILFYYFLCIDRGKGDRTLVPKFDHHNGGGYIDPINIISSIPTKLKELLSVLGFRAPISAVENSTYIKNKVYVKIGKK